MKSAIPQNLMGILEPLSGDGYVLLGFAPIGYVKEDEVSRLDADAMFKTAWDRIQRQNSDRVRQGLPGISAMHWEMNPAYSASEHSLEWALRSEMQGETVINHTVRLMGRRGVLDLTAVHSAKSDSIPLRDLAQGIAFREGENYASYKSGDKLAAAGAVELLISDSASPESGVYRNPYVWGVGLGAIICGLATGGVIVLKRTNRRKGSHGRGSSSSGSSSSPSLGAATRSEPSRSGLEIRTTFVADHSKPSVQLPPVALKKSSPSGKGNNNHNNHHHHGDHRRKMFDYNRYFTDLMSAVSNHGNLTEGTPVNGHSHETGRMGVVGEPAESEPGRPLAAFNDNSEMISQQKNLIEEQKRIIEEQSRLIEEKSQLIAEKNQFLKMQTELIDTKLI